MNNDEVYCLSCDWSGKVKELKRNKLGDTEFCPECYSTYLEDIEDEVIDNSNFR